jgi:hypothetical protein
MSGLLVELQPYLVVVTVLLVGYLAWVQMKLNVSVSTSGFGATQRFMSLNDFPGSTNQQVGKLGIIQGMGNNEPPVFWNAGSMATIADAQTAGLASEQLDNGSAFVEGMRGKAAYVSRQGMANNEEAVAKAVSNPY